MTTVSVTGTSTTATSTITTSTGTATSTSASSLTTSITSVTTSSITSATMSTTTTGHTTTDATRTMTSITTVSTLSMTSTNSEFTTTMSSTSTSITATASSSTTPTTATMSSTTLTTSTITTPTSKTGTITSETSGTSMSVSSTSDTSSSTLYSATVTTVTTTTVTATSEGLSEVRSTLWLTFETGVSDEDAEATAKHAVALYVNISVSLITVESVTVSQPDASGSARRARALSSELSYEIVYTIRVVGSDTEREEVLASLTELFNNASSIESILQAVVADLGLPNVVSVVGAEPEVLVSTATHTTTTDGNACYADSLSDRWGVASSSSCVGIASGASCSPECNDSYELIGLIKCTNGTFDEPPLICIHSEHWEALELVEVFLIEIRIVSNEADSDLTADWASRAGSEAAIKSSIAKILSLLHGQIFLKGQQDLNSVSSSPTLSFEAVLQPYPSNTFTLADVEDTIPALESNFINELQAALQDAAPPGLATASLVVGTPEAIIFTLPLARWVARTDWSTCDNSCGEGELSRTVECVGAWGSDANDLCNANAAPGFTKESYMPDSASCMSYTSCPYDWSCPGGPDPETGDGCETQASGVAIGIVIAFLVCACMIGAFIRKIHKKPEGEDIQWTREGGVVDKEVDIQWSRKDGTTKKNEKTVAHVVRSGGPMLGCATLTPRGGTGDPIGPVNLDFSGTIDFELQIQVRTTAKDSLLVGKVYRWGGATYKSGGAKALVIKKGIPTWQVGGDSIYGRTYIADGKQHVISISYNTKEDQYVLKVDGREEARGLHGVADNPDASLVLGTASAPRDDMYNAVNPLLEELRSAGVEVSPLEGRAEEPLFDGDVDFLTWSEYRKKDGRMAWLAYDLHIDTEDVVAERLNKQTSDKDPKTAMPDKGSATSTSRQLFHKGQTVEYWSVFRQTWLPARVLDVTGTYYDDALNFNALSYDIHLEAAEQTVQSVGMKDLRVPFVAGESVSVFSQKRGGWFPARIHRSRHDEDSRLVYDITLEGVFDEDEDLQTYVMSELQRDLERFAGPATQDGIMPALKNMPSKRLRRRYGRGDHVRLYRGADVGFVEAEVVREEPEEHPARDGGSPSRSPSPDDEARGRSPSPSTSGRARTPPGAGRPPRHSRNSSPGEAGAESAPRRRNFGDQRHATVVLRRVGAGAAGRDGGTSGAGKPDEMMTVPDYVLRHPIENGAPLSPRGRGPRHLGATPLGTSHSDECRLII